MGSLTESLASFIHGLTPDAVPDDAIATAGRGFCDVVGVSIAALDQPVVRHLSEFAMSGGGRAEARLLFGERRVPAPEAALVGGVAAHALDFDDYAFSNHVSAVLVPAILAEAEVTGATGRQMLGAYVAGYEVWCELIKREPGDWYDRGWHPTAIMGGFGALAASAFLRRLPETKIRHALGLCTTLGGGIMDNFGSMAKPFQGGRAAQAGLLAVRLAEAGLDAGPDALDGDNGYLRALSPSGDPDIGRPANALGEDWWIRTEKLNIKRYPTVGASQRCIDCAIQLRQDHAPDPDAIAQIRPHIGRRHAHVMPQHRPATALEAKFSLEFAVAAGLTAGAVGFRELTDSFVARDDVQKLMTRVEPVIDADDDPVYPAGKAADFVEITMTDGTILRSRDVARWRGHGENPMTQAELRDKFMDCATRCITREAAAACFDLFRDIGTLKSVDDIPRLSTTVA